MRSGCTKTSFFHQTVFITYIFSNILPPIILYSANVENVIFILYILDLSSFYFLYGNQYVLHRDAARSRMQYY